MSFLPPFLSKALQGSPRLPEAPRGSQTLPEVPRGCQKLPKGPRGSQKLPKAPRSSQRLPKAPRSSQKHPKAHRSSQRLPENKSNISPILHKMSLIHVRPSSLPFFLPCFPSQRPATLFSESFSGKDSENGVAGLGEEKHKF